MSLIRPERWLFSIKTFLAGMLALAVAFWLDLPRPYWALATVYVASQPLAGATHSKAFFRAIGTLAGAAMAVLLVPNLVDAPPVLVLAVAFWSGLCLYLSILHRTPRGYAFMLAGYTTAIIGFPAVDAPGEIFNLALSRSEEILIGILCAALVSSLIFPQGVGPAVAARAGLWLSDARIAALDALRQANAVNGEAHWLRLAADTSRIESVAAHLPFETSFDRRALMLARRLVLRMLMTLPEISAIRDIIPELDALGGPSPRMAALITQADAVLTGTDADGLARLCAQIDGFVAASISFASWRDVVELNLANRLLDLAQLFSDIGTLVTAIADDAQALPGAFAFPIDSRAARLRHNEHGRAATAGATLCIALLLCCSFWILTSWPEGAAAAMMTAVAGSLFAAQENPAAETAKFAGWSAVAVGLSGVYVFCILPGVHYFETLALALAPALLLFGLLIAEPRTFVAGVALGILTPSAMALQPAYDAHAEAFLNSGLAMVSGMAIAATTAAVMRCAGANWRAAGFVLANVATLAEAADVRAAPHRSRAVGALFDRLSLLAPLMEATNEPMPGALRQLRAGLNLVEARETRAGLAWPARRRLDAALLRIRRSYRKKLTPGADALAALDRVIQALNPGEAAERKALLALAGLRRCLFPAATTTPAETAKAL